MFSCGKPQASAFIPICIDYVIHTDRQQASIILELVKALQQEGYEEVGITYSANYAQTVAIAEAYKNNKWKTGTSGGNQAAVLGYVEQLLATQYQDLQKVFRILPITSCARTGGFGKVEDEWLDKDLNNIQSYLKKPATIVLGWQNQKTVNSHAPFAVGGAISLMLTPDQNNKIQDSLKSLLATYSCPALASRLDPILLNKKEKANSQPDSPPEDDSNALFNKAIQEVQAQLRKSGKGKVYNAIKHFKDTLENLKNKTLHEIDKMNISLADAKIIAQNVKALAENPNKAQVDIFKCATRKFQNTWSWKAILGAVIGAVIGIIVGAMIGVVAGPGAALTALAGGINGAVIGATLFGISGVLTGIGLDMLYTSLTDPLIETAGAAMTVKNIQP